MNINIIAVGNIKESYYREAISEYVKRISKYATVNITEIKEERFDEDSASDSEIAKILEKEGKSIISAIEKIKSTYVIALCVEGKKYSSPSFAALLDSAISVGKTPILVIGSSHGLSDEVKNYADARMSFSDMTFPHRLMRVILCEQIYRAFSINAGGKYHK